MHGLEQQLNIYILALLTYARFPLSLTNQCLPFSHGTICIMKPVYIIAFCLFHVNNRWMALLI
jgi:hypothetical protein